MIRPRKVSIGDTVLAEHHNEIVDAILERTPPTAVPGGRIFTGPHGWNLTVRPGKGRVSAGEVTHPFQVLQRPHPTTANVWQYGVIYQSSLYRSLSPGDRQKGSSPGGALVGVLSEDQTTGWFNLTAGSYIWLGITFSTAAETTFCGIDNSDENTFDLDAAAWDPTKNAYVNDDEDPVTPTHQVSRKLIAATAAGATGQPPVLTQVMFRDQLLRNVCIDGRPARYPFDHEGGYPL